MSAITPKLAPASAKWIMNTQAAEPIVTTETATHRSSVRRPTFWLSAPYRTMPLAVVRLETISNQLTFVGLWCSTGDEQHRQERDGHLRGEPHPRHEHHGLGQPGAVLLPGEELGERHPLLAP